MVISPCQLMYPHDISNYSAMSSLSNEISVITGPPQTDSPFLPKFTNTIEIDFKQPTKLAGFSSQSISNASAYHKVRSYPLNNDLHLNSPFLQYKFPLSEHTEEG